MKVLNATHRVFNLMTDRGEVRQIKPGTVSEVMVATKNLILGAIRQGSPQEVGIILGGTYEQGIANSITGGHPYYYLSEEEAKAKLIDPTVDYKAGMRNTQTNELKEELVKLQNEIENFKKEVELKDQRIAELEANAGSDESREIKLKQAEEAAKDAEIKLKTALATIEGQESTLKDKDVQIQKLTAERDALKERVDPLAEEVKNLRQYKEDHPEVELPDYEDELNKLKAQVEESNNQLENVKGILHQVVEDFSLEWSDDLGKFVAGDTKSPSVG